MEKIYREVRALWCSGRREEAEQRCRDGLREFPDAYCLMEELAWNLSYSRKREDLEESIALFTRIRSSVSDENTRNFALGTLCELYMKIGQRDEAKRIAEEIPVLTYSKEDCIKMTLRGEELAAYTRELIADKFDKLIWALTNFLRSFGAVHPLFEAEELLVLWQKVIDFSKTFYENADFGFHEQCVIFAHHARARLYIELGENECALDELACMQAHIAHFDAYADGLAGDCVILPREKWHTSLLVRPRDEDDPAIRMTVSIFDKENTAAQVLRDLADPIFNPLRSHPRFCAVEAGLRSISLA